MKKTTVRMFLIIFTAFFCVSVTTANSAGAPGKAAAPSRDGISLIVKGIVIAKDEIWDRRTNPLMGRPDFLKEIRLTIEVISVLKGGLSGKEARLHISVKGGDKLVKYKYISTGQTGIFYLSGGVPQFSLESFDLISPAPAVTKPPAAGTPWVKNTPKPVYGKVPDEIAGIGGSKIAGSKELQQKAVRVISGVYGMKNASFVSMTSYQGPMPPEGGYVYWGVKGLVKGKWHMWQPGYGLREGSGLEDPHRYQKCNSQNTLISTTDGAVPINELRPGDLIIGADGRLVPIIKVTKVKAENHKVCRILFEGGVTLEISPGHPLPGGRTAGSLQPGDTAGGRRIIKIELVPYKFDYTYDILPGSPSGTYLANGIPVASTLKGE